MFMASGNILLPETSIIFASLPYLFVALHVYTPNFDSLRIFAGNSRLCRFPILEVIP